MAKSYFGSNSVKKFMEIIAEQFKKEGTATDEKITAVSEELQKVADQVSTLGSGTTEGLDKKLDADQVGVADGVCPLGGDGLVDSTYLPSYVDDVIEGYLNPEDNRMYEKYEAGEDDADGTYTEEITPERGKIYVDLSNNYSYRWSGSTYVLITSSDLVEMTSDDVQAMWDAVLGVAEEGPDGGVSDDDEMENGPGAVQVPPDTIETGKGRVVVRVIDDATSADVNSYWTAEVRTAAGVSVADVSYTTPWADVEPGTYNVVLTSNPDGYSTSSTSRSASVVDGESLTISFDVVK